MCRPPVSDPATLLYVPATDLPPGSPRGVTVGVDIGGTKVLAGVLDGEGRVLARERVVTPGQDVTAVEDTIVELVGGFSASYDVTAVGVGAAGFIDSTRSTVLFAPHLAWRREPLKAVLADRLGLPVLVDNDANAAGVAEAHFGAGQGHRFVLCVTLGTGIGGALVIDGKVHRGDNGVAGEFGHMQVVPAGLRCPCGNRGCWEQYASGTALVREARELVLGPSPAAHLLRERVGADAALLTGPLVTGAAREGDPLSLELLADVGRWLGVGLANLAAAFDPGVVVVGGGVSEAGDLLLAPTRDAFARQVVGRGYRDLPEIVTARLGEDAGLVGAAYLAREALRA